TELYTLSLHDALPILRATTGVGGEREQLVVQGEDLRPVGLLECRGVRMDGVDRGLELVCTRLIAAKALADDRLTLLDQGAIPFRSEEHTSELQSRSDL